MTRTIRFLEKMDRKASGFLEACRKIGREKNGLLEMDSEQYESLREKFGFSRGLGDAISKITKAVGIKPCKGCKKRRAQLNKTFPFS